MNVEQRGGTAAVDDRTIEAMLARRAAGSVPRDLKGMILADTECVRQVWSFPGWLAPPAGRLAWILALTALLAAVFGVSLLAGARPSRGDDPLRPAVAPADVSAMPIVYGERVSGTWASQAAFPSGDRAHAGTSTVSVATDDLRVAGDGTYDVTTGLAADVGSTTGVLSIGNAGGVWSGRCTGGSWPAEGESSVALACWLDGSGAYDGATVYLQLLGGSDVPMRVDGIVYRGDAPPEEVAP